MDKFNKAALILMGLLIFTLIGCNNIENIKVELNKKCTHEYILEPIEISPTQTFGLTEIIYYRENDDIYKGYENAYIIFTGVIENIGEEKSSNSITSISIKANSDSVFSYDDPNGEYTDFDTATGTEEGFLRVHKDDSKHREVNMIIGVTKDLEEYTNFEITLSKPVSDENIVIDIPVELVKEELDYQKLKKDLFNKYYEIIDSRYSSNELFKMQLKEIYLDDRDFFGQIEIKNISEYNLENLSVFVNPIMSDGFGYIGGTNPSFNRTNGYLSLESGESRIINFRVNMDEVMNDLYFGDDELYPEREILDGEKFIFAVGISQMANDENMIFPDSNLGTVMHYFKDNLKVGRKKYTEKEEEELKKTLIKQDTESIYDADIKVEDVYKVKIADDEEDVLVVELDITSDNLNASLGKHGVFYKNEDILTVYGVYNDREEEIDSRKLWWNLYSYFGTEQDMADDCIIPVLGTMFGDNTVKNYIAIELSKYDDHEKYDGYRFEIAREDNLGEAFTFTFDKKIIKSITQEKLSKNKYNEIKNQVNKNKYKLNYGNFEVKDVIIEDDCFKIITKFKNITSRELKNVYFMVEAMYDNFETYRLNEDNGSEYVESILPREEITMEWISYSIDNIYDIKDLIINLKVNNSEEWEDIDSIAVYWDLK